MKKYLIVSLLFFVPFLAKASTPQIFGFMDGKYYDLTQALKYFCFSDSNCYDLQGTFAFTLDTPISSPISTAPTLTQQITQSPTVTNPITSCPSGSVLDSNGFCASQTPMPVSTPSQPVVNAPAIQTPSCTITSTQTDSRSTVSWSTQGVNAPGIIYEANRYINGQPDWSLGNDFGYRISANSGSITMNGTEDFEAIFGNNITFNKYYSPQPGDIVCTTFKGN